MQRHITRANRNRQCTAQGNVFCSSEDNPTQALFIICNPRMKGALFPKIIERDLRTTVKNFQRNSSERGPEFKMVFQNKALVVSFASTEVYKPKDF